MIKFSDFLKLEIKIGQIVAAEEVEDADRLYKLTVDLGDETRTLAAGVAEHYSTDELIDKQVPVLTNLEPKTLRGIESQGMMLAADDNGKPVLLTPEEEVPHGSIVK